MSKKLKIMSLLDRVEEFKEEMYADGRNVCRWKYNDFKFCQHSIDYTRVHTIKSHLITEKHQANKSKAESEAKKRKDRQSSI